MYTLDQNFSANVMNIATDEELDAVLAVVREKIKEYWNTNDWPLNLYVSVGMTGEPENTPIGDTSGA